MTENSRRPMITASEVSEYIFCAKAWIRLIMRIPLLRLSQQRFPLFYLQRLGQAV